MAAHWVAATDLLFASVSVDQVVHVAVASWAVDLDGAFVDAAVSAALNFKLDDLADLLRADLWLRIGCLSYRLRFNWLD